MTDPAYTPPLGSGDTAAYDAAIRRWTRESRWRCATLGALAPGAGETIVDVGCGTGTFAVMLKAACPGADVVGLDPDEQALGIARAKAAAAGVDVRWRRGFGRDVEGPVDAVVSSLMFHQMPLAEKRRSLAAMHAAIRPGGRLVVTDYGEQRGPMRLLFRLTIQRLDGTADTQPNADGILPVLIREAGFTGLRSVASVPTVTGSIAVMAAERP